MEDLGKQMEAGMQETAKVLALQASVKEGKRLLREALAQRNTAQSNERRILEQLTLARNLLWQLSTFRVFKLLPAVFKRSVRNFLGIPL